MTKQATAVICLSHYSGGMELDAISFAKKLNKHTKTILIVKHKSFMHKQLQGNDAINFETISFSMKTSISIMLKTRKFVKKHKIKNVVFFGASEMKSLYFSFLGLNINLLIRHSTTKSTPKKDWFHRLIYSDVNYHVSTSKHLQRNVDDIIPFGEHSKSLMIYSSIDISKASPEAHSPLTLVHTGRIIKEKGQEDAIRACQVLVENNIDFKFYIIGQLEENYEKEFLSFYNTLAYKDKIELVGFTNNVKSYLQKADIFVFPSFGEGLSLSFREALANDLACIAYDNTSFTELQEAGLHLHLAKDRDVKDLGHQLIECAKNISQEKKLLSKNNTILQNLFSEEKEINAYLEILQ